MQAKDVRIAAMLLGRRAVRVVPLPGFEAVEGEELPTVGVRILLESELDEARLDAIQYVDALATKYRIDRRALLEMDAELLDREVQRATVRRAFIAVPTGEEPSSKPGEHKPFFESIARVRMLDSVVFEALWRIYLEQHDYVSPYKPLTDEQAKELADALSKGRNAQVALELFASGLLRHFLLSLVYRPAT